MQVAKLSGIPIRIDPLLIAIMLPAFVIGSGWIVMASFVVVLVHELCHALAAKAFGIRTHSIELMPFGGVAKMDSSSGGAGLLVAAAGPAFNLLAAMALNWLAQRFPLQREAIAPWLQANMVIGIFNLIPAYPLDGGRILQLVLEFFTGREMATRIACWVGMVIGGMMAASGFTPALEGLPVNVTLLMTGGFVAVGAWRELQSLPYTAIKNASSKKRSMRSRPLKEKHIAAQYGTSARDVMRNFSGGHYHTVTVLDDDMDIVGSLGENDIVKAVADDGNISMQGILMRSSGRKR